MSFPREARKAPLTFVTFAKTRCVTFGTGSASHHATQNKKQSTVGTLLFVVSNLKF